MNPVFEYMMSLTPIQFEEEVEKYLLGQGFTDIRRRGGAGDEGVDLYCRVPDGARVAVQCKRWSRSIGSPTIQTFAGVVNIHPCDRAMFVTASTFTDQAQRIARKFDIELIDGNDLSPHFAPEVARQEAARQEAAKQAIERKPLQAANPAAATPPQSAEPYSNTLSRPWVILALIIVALFVDFGIRAAGNDQGQAHNPSPTRTAVAGQASNPSPTK